MKSSLKAVLLGLGMMTVRIKSNAFAKHGAGSCLGQQYTAGPLLFIQLTIGLPKETSAIPMLAGNKLKYTNYFRFLFDHVLRKDLTGACLVACQLVLPQR